MGIRMSYFCKYQSVNFDNPDERRAFEKNLLTKKQYEDLKCLYEKYPPSYLGLAIESIDIDAIKIMMSSKKLQNTFDIRDYTKYLIDSIEYNFDHVHKLQFSYKQMRNQVKEMLKLLLSHDQNLQHQVGGLMNASNDTEINKSHKEFIKEYISPFFTMNELKEYIPEGLIQDINIAKYQAEAPLFTGQVDNSSSPVDLILSHTYSPSLSVEEVRDIYNDLYDSKDVMTKEMLTILAINIAQGDEVKVIFSDDRIDGAHYAPYNNIIEVGTKNTGKFFTIPSVFIHEVGHYVIDALYRHNSSPIPGLYALKEELMETKHTIIKDPYVDLRDRLISDIALEKASWIKDPAQKVQKYYDAVAEVIIYAGKLLDISAQEFNNYELPREYVNYVRDNSPLGLFMENAIADNDSSEARSISLQTVVAKYYYDFGYTDTSPNPYNHFTIVDFKTMKQKVMEEYFPKLVQSLNLTDQQVFFLERIADFAYREKYGEIDDDSLDAELIVRYPELLEAGVTGKELEILKKTMGEYWLECVSPDVHTEINTYKAKCSMEEQSNCSGETPEYCINFDS